ncbi:hypothetical protein RAD16_04990 [Bradyrhizobium sp. 18BD]
MRATQLAAKQITTHQAAANAKVDRDSLSIEELAELRERANAMLLAKVAARQAELEVELERLSQDGKPAKRAALAPDTPKPHKDDVVTAA